MKKISLIASAFILCAAVLGAQAQVPSKLPDDPRVKSGTMANGLSYIIVKNQAQAGAADFCVAQKVGTSLEEKGNHGSFLLLQQLATKGTRNFEGTAIVDYLSALGLRKEDIVFSTGGDELVYLIKDIPVERSNTIDSALLILYNWMSTINLDEEDIEKERGALKTRILGEWNANKRLVTKQIRELYPKSPYGTQVTPEFMAGLNSINSKDLRSFYYNWCRPSLQCVIVVGDVDLDKTETRIKSIFSTIPKPLKAGKRKYFTPDSLSGIHTVILKDKEYNKTTVSVNFLKQPLKAEYRTTNLPYIQDFMDATIMRVLQDRIREGALQENIPLYEFSITKGRFLEMANTFAYTISFETLPNSVYASLSFISGELKKLARYGFNNQEFNKSVELYWKYIENLYDNRASAGNDIYLARALNNYFEGYSLASTEMRFEIMKQILFSLSAKDLNDYTQALLDQEDNVVISCFMPDAEGIAPISKERLLAAFSNALDKSPSLYKDARVLQWPVVNISAASSIISEDTDPVTGANVIILSNGATLVFKETQNAKDTISFKAVSKGGFSLMKGISLGNKEYMNGLLNVGGLGSVSEANLKRLYGYNNIRVTSIINENTEEITGYSASANASGVEKMMQALYLSMTGRRSDAAAFDLYTKKAEYDILYHAVSPLGILSDTVAYYNNSNKSYVAPVTAAEQIRSYNYQRLQNDFKERFSNAGDFFFIFAGKNVNDFKELAIKYIGAIPGNSAKESWTIVPNYLAKGRIEKRFLINMDMPRSYADVTFSCSREMSLKNKVLSYMAKAYVENLLHTRLYTMAYNASVSARLEYYPENIFVMNVRFEADSANMTPVCEQITTAIEDAAAGRLSGSEFATLKKEILRSYARLQQTNQYWLDVLEIKYINNKDFISGVNGEIEGITLSEFENFCKELLGGNRITVIMDGTTADIPTQRLLRENRFVRDFFNVQ